MPLAHPVAYAPSARRLRRRGTARRRRRAANRTARVILAELQRRPGRPPVRYLREPIGPGTAGWSGITVVDGFRPDLGAGERAPVLVHAGHHGHRTGPVVAALDDDDNPGVLIEVAAAEAARRGVPLRAAYVWTDCRPPDCDHHLVCHRDLGEAAGLLTALIDSHLPVAAAAGAERDVLHSTDPALALIGLSAQASLLVVGASSYGPRSGKLLGDTATALLGRTACPLVVVPHRGPRKAYPGW